MHFSDKTNRTKMNNTRFASKNLLTNEDGLLCKTKNVLKLPDRFSVVVFFSVVDEFFCHRFWCQVSFFGLHHVFGLVCDSQNYSHFRRKFRSIRQMVRFICISPNYRINEPKPKLKQSMRDCEEMETQFSSPFQHKINQIYSQTDDRMCALLFHYKLRIGKQ